jgi:hypothetical protein
MSYLGMTDGWHGDEDICMGNCGLCDTCEQTREEKGEDGYESWISEQWEGSYE